MTTLKLKRAYDPADPSDGYRIYIDHLWPRGLSHETFHYDMWDKELAPSTELREWFHQDPDSRWEEFATRYAAELKGSPQLETLRKIVEAQPGAVTLLYSSHDREHNNAVVAYNLLEGK